MQGHQIPTETFDTPQRPADQRHRRWILNAFDMSCAGHQSPGLWKHPDDRSASYHDIE